jgi:hypothetical protein
MNIADDIFLFLDILGYVGYTLLAIGMFKIAKDERSGWTYRALGGALWVGISSNLGLTSGVVFGLAFLAIDLFAVFTTDNSPEA